MSALWRCSAYDHDESEMRWLSLTDLGGGARIERLSFARIRFARYDITNRHIKYPHSSFLFASVLHMFQTLAMSIRGHLFIPPISLPTLNPPTFSHSIFCLVTGNCLLNPLKLPSLNCVNPLLSSSCHFLSTFAISFTTSPPVLP